MKKSILFIAGIAISMLLASCDNDKLDGNSIFEDDMHPVRNEFDEWLLSNYVYPYGIEVQYKLEHLDTDLTYTLAPTDYDRAQILARVFKHAWLEAYDEAAGINFTRQVAPRQISLIGSGRYNAEGGNAGLSEDGVKVSLYKCNEYIMTASNLNGMFLHNLHHAIAHGMLKIKKMNTSFEKISAGAYTYDDWYLRQTIEAYQCGFITPYAGSRPEDDVAELLSTYMTMDDEDWQYALEYAGETGKSMIEAKLSMLRDYLSRQWNIDLDHLKNTVRRRLNEIENRTVDVTPIENINPDLPSILY